MAGKRINFSKTGRSSALKILIQPRSCSASSPVRRRTCSRPSPVGPRSFDAKWRLYQENVQAFWNFEWLDDFPTTTAGRRSRTHEKWDIGTDFCRNLLQVFSPKFRVKQLIQG